MGKENRCSVGRFEAMQSTKNALTGNKKRGIDLLSRMKANPEEKPLVFTPQDQALFNDFYTLNQEAQKKIQEKIEARVVAAQAKKEQEKQEKPLSKFEMTIMVWKLLAEAQNKALKKTAEEVISFIVDRLPSPVYKTLTTFGIMSLILNACASMTPTPEVNPAGDNNTPSGEMTGLPTEETTEPEETALPEKQPTADAKIEVYRRIVREDGNAYVQALDAQRPDTIPQAMLTFVDKLTTEEDRVYIDITSLDTYTSSEQAKQAGVDSYSYSGVTPYGEPFIAFFNDPQTERTGYIFDIWDNNGPLVATREGALEIFDNELVKNPQYAKLIEAKLGITIQELNPADFALTTQTNRLVDLVYLPTGTALMGVNRHTKQWEFIDQIGGLVATPTMPPATEDPSQQLPEGVLTSEPAVITELVKQAKESNTYPSGLSEEQELAWFKELNKQRESQPYLYKSQNPSGDEYILIIPNSDQTENIIDQIKKLIPGLQAPDSQYPCVFALTKEEKNKLTPEILEQLKPQEKWVPIHQLANGQLAYFDSKTQTWMPIAGSENKDRKFWESATDPKTLDIPDGLRLYKSLYELKMNGKLLNELQPVVLPANSILGMETFLFPDSDATDGNITYLETLKVLSIKYILDDKGNLVPIGQIIHLPTLYWLKQGHTIRFTFEGQSDKKDKFIQSINQQPNWLGEGAMLVYLVGTTDPSLTFGSSNGGMFYNWAPEELGWVPFDKVREQLTGPIDLGDDRTIATLTTGEFDGVYLVIPQEK